MGDVMQQRNQQQARFICPKHPHVELWGVLKGGAGWCSSCCLFTQAAGVPEPVRDIPRPSVRTRRRKQPPSRSRS